MNDLGTQACRGQALLSIAVHPGIGYTRSPHGQSGRGSLLVRPKGQVLSSNYFSQVPAPSLSYWCAASVVGFDQSELGASSHVRTIPACISRYPSSHSSSSEQETGKLWSLKVPLLVVVGIKNFIILISRISRIFTISFRSKV